MTTSALTRRSVPRSPVTRRAGLVIALAVVLLGVLFGRPTTASAHAVVVSSDPADGARLKAAPTTVNVRFDESVGLNPGYLRVVDAAGRRVDVGSATHPDGVGAAIAVSLRGGLGDGTYLASFRVVSADSHPVAGSIRFVVGSGPIGIGGGPSGTTAVNAGVSVLLAVAHWLSFAGVGLVGGSWLIFSIWPTGQRRRSVRRAIWTGWVLAAAGAVAEFALQGPYASGGSLSSAWHTGLLDATLHINAGHLLSLRVLLLGVLGLVLTALLGPDELRKPSWGPEAAAIVGVGVVVTFAASGHSQSADPRWLAVLVDALHLTAMIVWLGGLAVLAVAAVRRRAAPDRVAVDGDDDVDAVELAAGLPIFSRVALGAVATLVVTGTIQAWREVGTIDALPTTWYGRLVIAKVVLTAVIVAVAYGARRIVRRRDWRVRGAAAAPVRPLQRMRRTIVGEVLVGAVVLGVTGVLISQPPGDVALAAQRSKAKSTVVAVTGTARARVVVDPGVHGTVEVQITLLGPVTVTRLTASAALPAKSLGPFPLPLQAAGPQTYSASGVLLPAAGDWQITVTVQTSEFDSTTAVAKVHLS